MSAIAIYNNFKGVDFLKNRFTRTNAMDLWDANIHTNAVLPYKCPEKLCYDVPDHASLYPLRECECLGMDNINPPVKGFGYDQHFFIRNGRLYQSVTTTICDRDADCLAGAPIPKTPSIDEECDDSVCSIAASSYVITTVTQHAGIDVESSPSPRSSVIRHSEGFTPTLRWKAPVGGYCITRFKIYRSENHFEDAEGEMPVHGSEWLLIEDMDVSSYHYDEIEQEFVYTDTKGSHNSEYPLLTHDPMLFPAPSDLSFLQRTEDGLVVANEHQLFISIAGQPLFTYEGIVSIEDKIRGIFANGNTIMVLTDKFPVLVQYSHTENILSVERTTVYRHLPLIDYRAASLYNGVLFFPSEYSFYRWDLSGYGANIISNIHELLTPEQWKTIKKAGVCGTAVENGYFMSSKALNHSLFFYFEDNGVGTRPVKYIMPISFIHAYLVSKDYDGHIIFKELDEIRNGVKIWSIYRWDFRDDSFCFNNIHDHEQRPMCEKCQPWRISLRYNSTGKDKFRVMRVEFDERTGEYIDLSFFEEYNGKFEPVVQNIKVISSKGFNIPKYTSTQYHVALLEGYAAMFEVRFATSYAELVSRATKDVKQDFME